MFVFITTTRTSRFQFHNGTINTFIVYYNDNGLFGFNSTTVQLIQVWYSVFSVNKLFQFHNGTINTSYHFFYTIFFCSFNSTTVQLIQKTKADKPHARTSFNSTTVQLIRYTRIAFALMQVFQFHNGTINTLSNTMNCSLVASFNSTTVQLIHLTIFFIQSISEVSIPQRYN